VSPLTALAIPQSVLIPHGYSFDIVPALAAPTESRKSGI
jgi:hypothetical protein